MKLLTNLALFAHVAEHGSFSAAARVLIDFLVEQMPIAAGFAGIASDNDAAVR